MVHGIGTLLSLLLAVFWFGRAEARFVWGAAIATA